MRTTSATLPSLSIIVPTYNERARLQELVEKIAAVFKAHDLDGEIVIVDDNSPDGTGEVADGLAAHHPVQVVHREGKLGLGTAVMAGFAAAHGELVGVMDGDLSHPPSLLPELVRTLAKTGADLVIASRYAPGGGVRNWPLSRQLMSRVACLLARPITPVRDATSGFFIIRRDAVRDTRIHAGGFKICLELLVRGQVGVVAEVPYIFTDRAAGESKMNTREALGYFRQLAALWRYYRSTGARRPRLIVP